MRDARPFLQIAHIGPWNVATPDALAHARAAAYARGRSAIESVARHDATAALALREWLEAVTLRDAVGRKLVTWLIETGSRTAHGDAASFAHAQGLARSLAHGATHARLVVAGARDTTAALDARFGARHPSAPLWTRAPHGAFEVHLYAQDTERAAHEDAHGRTAALREEYAPADRAPVLTVAAGFEHGRALRCCGADCRWVFSSSGDAESVTASAAAGGEQSVALLRVYASASQRRAAIVERLWFTRPLGLGPFRLAASRTAERLISWP